MKQNETLLNTQLNGLSVEEIGDEHVGTSYDTPMKADAFDMDDELKMNLIEDKFKEIMEIMGLDLTDDSLSGTPRRVAKMYIKEVFEGLNPENKPLIKLFENKYKYGEMLVEKNITVNSHCEHHFVPIIGKAHVGYISNGHVIGLSKINRIVRYYSKRPQVQERLTEQIAEALKNILKTDDVAVAIDAHHMCMRMRSIRHARCSTITSHFSGDFKKNDSLRNEFLRYCN